MGLGGALEVEGGEDLGADPMITPRIAHLGGYFPELRPLILYALPPAQS